MALTADQFAQMYADISPEARAAFAPAGVDPNVDPNKPLAVTPPPTAPTATAPNLAVTPPVGDGAPTNPLSVTPGASTAKASGVATDYSVPNAPASTPATDLATGQPTSTPATNTVNGIPLPYNVPITQPLPDGVAEPQLMPATDKYATPYYKAVTDNGDFAGAVMAAPDQQIRLVDSATGQVVYQGTGPEAARIAAATANSISQGDGKKAAWAIQGDTGNGQWTTQAQDAVDTKHPSLLGTLADIALPILGAILLPGVGFGIGAGLTSGALGGAGTAALGAALGSGVSSAAQGTPLPQALLKAGLSGLGAGVVGPAVGSVVKGLGGAATNAVSNAAVDASTTAATQAATQSALGSVGNWVAPVITTAIKQTVPQIVASGLSQTAINAAAAKIASDLTAQGATQSPPSTDKPLAPGETGVSPVVVKSATPNLPVVAAGGGEGVFGNLIDPVTVTGRPVATPSQTPADIAAAAGALTGTTLPDASTLNSDPNLLSKLTTMTPTQIAKLLPLLGLLGGAAGGSGGSGGSSGSVGNNGAAGTLASLNPIFSSALPPPGASFAGRTQTPPQGIDWKRYAIDNPEQAFFSTVKQNTPSVTGPTRAQLLAQGVSDLNHDGVIDAADLALFRKRYAAQGFAKGGRTDFAVHGEGDGRSDSIPAKLSNGEYVVDAETVSLLGNGSTQAGAKRLDQFRVNLRKAKGKQLARGRFSVNAKAPEAYMSGGRT